MNTQQKEALDYFGEYAQDWKRKADVATADKVNTIKQRNDFVVQVVSDRGNTGRVLDVGCGTGDLVCELAAKGLDAVGVDFAQEMIDIAVENAKKLKLEKAKFECSSIFDYYLEPDKYDVLAANGFIEYISYEELDKFLELSLKTLKPGGSLVVGSRNRLFNIFSLNAFTEQEIAEDALALLSEAVKVANAENIKDLIGLKTAPLQKEEKVHPLTGVKVSTRYQFTPIQLIDIFINKGFEPVEIFPIHIHGVPPKFKNEYPAIHGNISNLLQSQARGHMSLIPQSSSFMLHAKKK
ncbi:MAG: class I SAM-dependent methyltransferase [Patescibacteria group bacterium]|jgi:2-polyprenyl-3-methyl-5-hydroxy-6-metoxy-1,4-benzoquinol methylase